MALKIKLIKFLLKHLSVKEEHEILTMAVKDLFNSVTVDDILKKGKLGIWTFGDTELTEAEINNLSAEAKHFATGKLWKVLQINIKRRMNERMYIFSKSEYDLIAGKIGLYLLDVIKTSLKELSDRRQ